MAKAPSPPLPGRIKGRFIALVLILLLLYIVLPRLEQFSASFAAMRDARLELVISAVLLLVVTFGLAAGIYHSLALRLRGVQYRHTLLVQIAASFTNRLLPAGIGGVALNVQYLRKHGHSLPQAVAVASLNNMLGVVGHVLLLCAVAAISPALLTDRLELPTLSYGWLVGVGVGVAAIAALVVFRKIRHYLQTATHEVGLYLSLYRKRPEKLAVALLYSLLLTTSYVCMFYLCVHSLGIQLGLGQVFAVFSVGVVAGTVTPTPGGLVGAEAGLVAGLVAYGVEASPALAAVLLYRLITYWLPLLPGFVTFVAIRRRYL
jgi:undecaprenyl-diphosphatase